ncbi:MAG: tRNA(His) guanylyltransferase Thg1 family protein [Candidatus Sericytochromatia bacterium]
MKFDDLEEKLRALEVKYDRLVPKDVFMVARIDGRGFTKLTKETHQFNIPFDKKFSNYMIETTLHLMNCGFKVIYGYTESDEISLLFHPTENTFSRKIRKYNSILAGEASAKFTLLTGKLGVFDCRISELPEINDVIDYFRWRNEDALRNCLNAYCYWTLRKDNLKARTASKKLENITVEDKKEILTSYNIDFNEVPLWQKRGIGLYWEEIQKNGWNPKEEKEVITKRKKIKIDLELPLRNDYSDFIKNIILSNMDKGI